MPSNVSCKPLNWPKSRLERNIWKLQMVIDSFIHSLYLFFLSSIVSYTCLVLSVLAFFYERFDKGKMAEERQTQLLSLYEELLGPNHPVVG